MPKPHTLRHLFAANLEVSCMKLEKHTNSKAAEVLSLIAIVAVFLGVALVTLSRKENLFVDETLSYQLANQKYGESIYITNDVRIDDPKAYLEDAFSAHERFNYRNVILNQSIDVHPPLYYMILHTICSLFPGRFSWGFAAVINIAFAVLTLLILDDLLKEFALTLFCRRLILLFCAVSAGIQASVIFFRMYVMLGFWITAVTWLFIRESRPKNARYYLLLYIICLGGCLTHLHFYVYLASISVIYLIQLIIERKPRIIACHAAVITAATATALLVFPYTISQLLDSNRGQEARRHLLTTGELLPRLKWFLAHAGYDLIGRHLFQKGLLIAACLVVVLAIKNNRGIRARLIRLFLPGALFYAVVAATASFMHVRYLYPVYPLAVTGIGLIFALFVSRLPRFRRASAVLIAAAGVLLTVNAWYSANFGFLYAGYRDQLAVLDRYADADCLYILMKPDIHANIFSDYEELSLYRSLTVITAGRSDPDTIRELLGSDDSLVVIADSCYSYDDEDPREVVEKILDESGLPSHIADDWSYNSSLHSYYCTRG